MGKPATRGSSFVGSFFLLPWQGYGIGSVGPAFCPSFAMLYERYSQLFVRTRHP